MSERFRLVSDEPSRFGRLYRYWHLLRDAMSIPPARRTVERMEMLDSRAAAVLAAMLECVEPLRPDEAPCGCPLDQVPHDGRSGCVLDGITDRGTFASTCDWCSVTYEGRRLDVVALRSVHCDLFSHRRSYELRRDEVHAAEALIANSNAGLLW